MTDMLQTGSRWLSRMMKAHAAHAVTYVRGSDQVEFQATVGRTEFEIVTEFGVERFESRDYLVLSEDLVLDGNAVTPQRGDKIKETIHGEVLVFEVMAPKDEPPWRYSDPGHNTMRIHTKHVDVEEA